MSKPAYLLVLVVLPVVALLLSPLPAQEPPEKLDPAQSCTTKCHQDLTKKKFRHGVVGKLAGKKAPKKPAKAVECVACHKQEVKTKHEFEEFDDINESCETCHEMKLQENVHDPVEDEDCTSCHDPHASDFRGLLRAEQKALCAMCHADTMAKTSKKWVHGPVLGVKCTECHRPHSAPQAKLLDLKPARFCLKCHQHMATHLGKSKHVHDPVKTDCAGCHDAHGSDHKYQLKDNTDALCFSCHDKLKAKVANAPVAHGPLATGKRCLNCHQPHAAQHPKLLPGPAKDACAECHAKPVPRQGAKPVAPVARQIAGAKFLHGPVREGDCASCHDPHAAAHANLLHEAYPKTLYAQYDGEKYGLCFRCHDQRAFETEKTATLTSFRNGDVNLHYLHVNRKDKGRTCSTCHEMHGSNLPSQIAERVPFGQWMLPMNYVKQPNGGSCLPGCHERQKYDRGAAGGKRRADKK
ncbi:MAG: cytochrome c3 family protein [Planctomycetota bacterium]|jgi:predicted CXXCH cytochrome family protein